MRSSLRPVCVYVSLFTFDMYEFYSINWIVRLMNDSVYGQLVYSISSQTLFDLLYKKAMPVYLWINKLINELIAEEATKERREKIPLLRRGQSCNSKNYWWILHRKKNCTQCHEIVRCDSRKDTLSLESAYPLQIVEKYGVHVEEK